MAVPAPADATPEQTAEFVESLALEALGSERLWRSGSSAALADPGPQPHSAYVAAASVVSFADGVTGQQKEDLLNSTLLAQLAANHRFDREKDTLNWYEAYRTVLQGVGWRSEAASAIRAPLGRVAPLAGPVGPASRPIMPRPPIAADQPGVSTRLPGPVFTPVIATQPRFTASEAVLSVMRRADGERTAFVAESSLEALRRLPDRDRRVVIFETSSHSTGRGNFQIVSASCGSDQVLRMTIVAVFFATDESVPRVMSFTFGRGTQMSKAHDTMTLSPSDYSKVREQVIQQLGDQASAYIAEIPIEPSLAGRSNMGIGL
jgi:hypothetical protein